MAGSILVAFDRQQAGQNWNQAALSPEDTHLFFFELQGIPPDFFLKGRLIQLYPLVLLRVLGVSGAL